MMKSHSFCRLSYLPVVIILYALVFSGCHSQVARDKKYDSLFHDGDVIFQSLRSGQSDAIQLATNSKHSHCGIIFWEGNKCFVYEAYKKVRSVPIDQFIERSKGGHYAVRRVKNYQDVFSADGSEAFIKIYYDRYAGKIYDSQYAASDDKIYCSELVWKLYRDAANIELGDWKRLGDFDLSSKVVQEELTYTYGTNVPLNERIISPEALYTADNLVTVIEQ